MFCNPKQNAKCSKSGEQSKTRLTMASLIFKPTHCNVTFVQADFISRLKNQWYPIWRRRGACLRPAANQSDHADKQYAPWDLLLWPSRISECQRTGNLHYQSPYDVWAKSCNRHILFNKSDGLRFGMVSAMVSWVAFCSMGLEAWSQKRSSDKALIIL